MEALIVFTLCTGISMAAFIWFNAYMDRRTNKIFLWCIFMMFLMLPISYWEQVWSRLSYFSMGRVVMTALAYALRPVIPFFIFLCLVRTETWKEWLYGIPLWINGILSLLSIRFSLLFSFTEDNHFVRGPLNSIVFYTVFLYLGGILVYSFLHYSYQRSGEIWICIGIVVQLSLAIFLEGHFLVKNMVAYMTPLAIFYYYMYLFTMRFRVDQMTGVFTQNCFEMDKRREERRSFCGILSIDMNDLKVINDRLGHAEGNRRICRVADILQEWLPRRSRIYRVGGDEFVVLLPYIDEVELTRRTRRLRERLEDSDLSAALGWAVFRRDVVSMDQALKEADKEMYFDKARSKGKAFGQISDGLSGDLSDLTGDFFPEAAQTDRLPGLPPCRKDHSGGADSGHMG